MGDPARPGAPRPPAIPGARVASPAAPLVSPAAGVSAAKPKPLAQTAVTPRAPAVAASAVTPKAPAVAAAAPVASRPPPLVIPTIAWTSAPPPIPPRSFSTPPPPALPDSPMVETEPPPSIPTTALAVARVPVDVEHEDEPTRVHAQEDVRRALEIRDEARALLQQTLEEALAPIHYALRDLERRLGALERQPAPVDPPAAPAVRIQSRAVLPPPPAAASPVHAARRSDPFGGVITANGAAYGVPIPPAPRAASVDFDVLPFDGARRRRRVGLLFALLIVLVFSGLFGALISSYLR